MGSKFIKFSEPARRVLSLAQNINNRLANLENTMNSCFNSLESRIGRLEEGLQGR